jgi:hypothetical protein
VAKSNFKRKENFKTILGWINRKEYGVMVSKNYLVVDKDGECQE